jgi:hypothetical protein
LRHATAVPPSGQGATAGWQHSQIDPSGDVYATASSAHFAPSSEKSARRRVPFCRTSSHTAAKRPSASAVRSKSPSAAQPAASPTRTGSLQLVPPSGDRQARRSPPPAFVRRVIAATTIASRRTAMRAPRRPPAIRSSRSTARTGWPKVTAPFASAFPTTTSIPSACGSAT